MAATLERHGSGVDRRGRAHDLLHLGDLLRVEALRLLRGFGRWRRCADLRAHLRLRALRRLRLALLCGRLHDLLGLWLGVGRRRTCKGERFDRVLGRGIGVAER